MPSRPPYVKKKNHPAKPSIVAFEDVEAYANFPEFHMNDWGKFVTKRLPVIRRECVVSAGDVILRPGIPGETALVVSTSRARCVYVTEDGQILEVEWAGVFAAHCAPFHSFYGERTQKKVEPAPGAFSVGAVKVHDPTQQYIQKRQDAKAAAEAAAAERAKPRRTRSRPARRATRVTAKSAPALPAPAKVTA